MKDERGSMRRLIRIALAWAFFCMAVMLVLIPEFPSIVKKGAARAVKPAAAVAAPSVEKAPCGFRAETRVERRMP